MIYMPPDGHRDGDTYDATQDYVRLNSQQAAVFRLMEDGQWRTLAEISNGTGHPEASVSARLRDFRKPKFGSHDVEIQRGLNNQFSYRLILNASILTQPTDAS